jgi:hypothetical protein
MLIFLWRLLYCSSVANHVPCIVTGIVGVLLRYVTPLTIVPTVSLVGLSLFENAAEAASQHWGIAVG